MNPILDTQLQALEKALELIQLIIGIDEHRSRSQGLNNS